MAMDLLDAVKAAQFNSECVLFHRDHISAEILRSSPRLACANFRQLHPDDLRMLFDLCDQTCFDGACRASLGDIPLGFRISSRMTSSAGKTTRSIARSRKNRLPVAYEIAVSGTLLFQNFQQPDQPITVTGVPCTTRLEALQRVLEHEIVHLIEMLLWTNSSCASDRFQSIAFRAFGHTEHAHRLITPRERAYAKFGIRAGDRVAFRFEGRNYEGFVNRITKRATVLVEDHAGPRYSDGKHYAKYYVPVNILARVG